MRRFLTAFFILILATGPGAAPLEARQGYFRSSSYAVVTVDSQFYNLDVLAYGRRGQSWTGPFCRLEELPQDCLAALNGTFFSLRWGEPAGVLVYNQGHTLWTPIFKRAYGGRDRPVRELKRCYVAVGQNGRIAFGNSQGLTAQELCSKLDPRPRALMGGGGWLVQDGLPVLSSASLLAEGFDELSGLRPDAAVPRTGIGVDARGQIILVAALGGLGLKDFAQLFVKLGARQAIFLDCGSSTAMRAGSWQRGGGRAIPTWLVVRPNARVSR